MYVYCPRTASTHLPSFGVALVRVKNGHKISGAITEPVVFERRSTVTEAIVLPTAGVPRTPATMAHVTFKIARRASQSYPPTPAARGRSKAAHPLRPTTFPHEHTLPKVASLARLIFYVSTSIDAPPVAFSPRRHSNLVTKHPQHAARSHYTAAPRSGANQRHVQIVLTGRCVHRRLLMARAERPWRQVGLQGHARHVRSAHMDRTVDNHERSTDLRKIMYREGGGGRYYCGAYYLEKSSRRYTRGNCASNCQNIMTHITRSHAIFSLLNGTLRACTALFN